ncbi:helix-turn-helix domain-containing protein [Streptosporangium sp. NPDC023963]|uniref:winged helix-turn-helix transcriptional regulator n=1 Tax=Streptosporangium sp. NPDC023963 TaxID=3155608 RepID=UPI0034432373
MRWKDIGDVDCSVARTLSVIGDRWTMLVLRDAFLGVRRFDDFRNDLGLSRHLLADRLGTLVEHGILERRPYSERPLRHEYRLTAKGLDLYPVIISIAGWGDRWMAGEDGPPLPLRHRSCGEIIAPALTCPCCGERIDPRQMTPVSRTASP